MAFLLVCIILAAILSTSWLLIRLAVLAVGTLTAIMTVMVLSGWWIFVAFLLFVLLA